MPKTVPLEKIAEIAAKAGAEIAVSKYVQLQKQDKQEQIDKRYHNTKILLENYPLLKEHCENAVYDRQQLYPSGEDMLKIEMFDEEDFNIKSILRTKERTAIFVAHIDSMMEYYHQRGKTNDEYRKRYEVLKALYFDGKSINEISEAMGVVDKTVSRTRNKGIGDLSTLLFGFEGLEID